HPADATFVKIDWLWQTIASALLSARLRGIEFVQAQARHERQQIGARRVHLLPPAGPAQPGLLSHVLSATNVAEHAVGMRDEQRPVRFEDREISVSRVSHQNGFTSISTAITAMSAHIPYAIRSTLRRTPASSLAIPRRTARRAWACKTPAATSNSAD